MFQTCHLLWDNNSKGVLQGLQSDAIMPFGSGEGFSFTARLTTYLKCMHNCRSATAAPVLPPSMASVDLDAESDSDNSVFLDLVWGAYGQESPRANTARDRYLPCSSTRRVACILV